jgi:hypothetical protein
VQAGGLRADRRARPTLVVLGGRTERGWTQADYEDLRDKVMEYQRPTTDAEYEDKILEQLRQQGVLRERPAED